MKSVAGVIPQLRTTDLAGSIRFYTEKVGFTLELQYEDFYAGIRAGSQLFHLKLVSRLRDTPTKPSDTCEDLVGRLRPHERFGRLVGEGEVLENRLLESVHG